MSAVTSSSSLTRWPIIDALRGIAVIAMIGFHFTWDLGFFQMIDYDISFTTEGRVLSHLIAGTFLFLVGVSLTLAHRKELNARAFLKRFFKIAGAAALVSLGTFFATPEEWIFFGVLHCISLSSLLALPFLRAPLIIVFLVAVIALSAPTLIANSFFDRPDMFWLGLNKDLPRTNDYVPLLPWLGVVLMGVVTARLLLTRDAFTVHLARPSFKPLTLMGRYALPIYLLHQPVLMGLLWVFVTFAGPFEKAAVIEPAFFQNCSQSCASSGRSVEACDRACSCIGRTLSGMKNPTGDDAIQSALAICRKDGAL